MGTALYLFVMGGLEPPIHLARVGAPIESIAPAEAGAMGGRLKAAHDG